jgi:acetylcholinesterase
MTDYLINFVVHLDPNGVSGARFHWPQYSNSSPQLLTFLDGLVPLAISEDTYRSDQISYVTDAMLKYPF